MIDFEPIPAFLRRPKGETPRPGGHSLRRSLNRRPKTPTERLPVRFVKALQGASAAERETIEAPITQACAVAISLRKETRK